MERLKQNWSELPEELLKIIAEKIEFSQDFIRFGAVCHPWRSVSLALDKCQRLLCLKSFPWLMLPADDDEDQDDNNRRFFIPFENRICSIYLPEAHGCHCWGSPYGWLVTLGSDHEFHLLNPLTRVRLPLPPRSTFNVRNFTDLTRVPKAIVVSTSSSSPKPQCNIDDLLVVINMGKLMKFAFARPGDKTWSVIQVPSFLKDFINFNGQFYGVCGNGRLMVFDFSVPHATFVDITNYRIHTGEGHYLVELGGELHMVVRDVYPVKAVYLYVLKFHFCTLKWEALKTLGDHAIFIGSNTTFGLKASDYPACKPDCIYFTDDYHKSFEQLVGADMGIYNLQSRTIEPLYEGDDIRSRFTPPIWISKSI